MNRAQEVAAKLGRLVNLMEEAGADGVRLRGIDWFAWVTAGGSNVVVLASDVGVAEVFLTKEGAWILTDEIEADRLRDEEIVGPLQVWSHPWADASAKDAFVNEQAPGHVLSDRPAPGEDPLPASAWSMRWTLLDNSESGRLRTVGRLAAEAMTEALTACEPTWTERDLAAAGSAALVKRGLEPGLVMAAGERRLALYRHFVTKDDPVGSYGGLVFCARGQGLYVSITRFVSFGKLDERSAEAHEKVRTVEARVLEACRLGARFDDLYDTLRRAYEDVGERDAINQHHQGGLTGYRAREVIVTPDTKDVLPPNCALAWNPSVIGAKIEDTIFMDSAGAHQVLTLDPAWPTVESTFGPRPAVLEK
ncbi:M24 family metallopeptidase [Deinococcus yavapaiensis]|uniref:Xaa-Pro aminopeptidase n=1 Tax=Deinococcus yavapaiensis KR-236 TaxID=694435 RepID=A0A318S6E4_9DEIO|nr:M24 family metallopeptidase [Deinococcus yavapaiensis]PYE54463.1 Xaa-Pro aminopeptidase [Deinococcus yavapaiensis KR-236]